MLQKLPALRIFMLTAGTWLLLSGCSPEVEHVLQHPVTRSTPEQMYDQTIAELAGKEYRINRGFEDQKEFIDQFISDLLNKKNIELINISTYANHFVSDEVRPFKFCQFSKTDPFDVFSKFAQHTSAYGPFVIYEFENLYVVEAFNYFNGGLYNDLRKKTLANISTLDNILLVQKPIAEDSCEAYGAKMSRCYQGDEECRSASKRTYLMMRYQGELIHANFESNRTGYTMRFTRVEEAMRQKIKAFGQTALEFLPKP